MWKEVRATLGTPKDLQISEETAGSENGPGWVPLATKTRCFQFLFFFFFFFDAFLLEQSSDGFGFVDFETLIVSG